VIFDSGITAAAITAVLLNIVFNIVGRTKEAEGPIFAEAPAPAEISDEDEARLDPTGPAAHGVHQSGQARDTTTTVAADGEAAGGRPAEDER
jgi:hypothetical protein